MKGTVVQIRNNKAAVLTEDGAVRLLPNYNYRIGQVISVKKKSFAAIAAAAAAAVAICTMGVGAVYTAPYSTVSLDVNPSIELSLNRFDRVIDIISVNEDAAKVIASVKLKNMSTEQAIEALAQAMLDKGYLTDAEGGVVVAVGSKDEKKAQELAKRLEERVRQTVAEKLGEGSEIAIEAEAVGAERVERAHELGLTPGKLNLIEKLAASADEELDEEFIEKWADASVKNIMKANKLSRDDLKNITKEIEKLKKEIEHNEKKGIDNALLEEMLDELSDAFEDHLDVDDDDDDEDDDIKPVNANKPDKKQDDDDEEDDDEKIKPSNSNKPDKTQNSNGGKPSENANPSSSSKPAKASDEDDDDEDKIKPSNPNKPDKNNDKVKPSNDKNPNANGKNNADDAQDDADDEDEDDD